MAESAAAWLTAFIAGAQSAGPLELVAVALGLAYIVLAIRQHRACWIVGGASTAIYIAIFLKAGLPLQAALQVAYVALSVYGWLAWSAGGDLPAQPRSWPLSRHLLAILAVLAATAASTPLLAKYTDSPASFADSLGTWASVAATWLLARRVLATWFWWMLIDSGLAMLFASQGLVFTAGLYLAYALLAIAGWRAWRGSASAVA
ncbi:MAG: nicotinamide riboside transporter PnuC [Steroidobacteraceae bacterium]